MSGHQQVAKLEKIIGFYEQKLEIEKARFQEQNAIVIDLENQYKLLAEERKLAQQRFEQMVPTATNHQHAAHWMETFRGKLERVERELAQAVGVLETRRIALQQQMSQIEILEKLVARKSELIAYELRAREQLISDERYLNTNFSGKKK